MHLSKLLFFLVHPAAVRCGMGASHRRVELVIHMSDESQTRFSAITSLSRIVFSARVISGTLVYSHPKSADVGIIDLGFTNFRPAQERGEVREALASCMRH
jgi:hypothetical protein